MTMTSEVGGRIREWVRSWPEPPEAAGLFRVLRFLGQWRSLMLANTFLRHEGARIHGGLFRGMHYVTASTEGALMPRLLGTYESELHPHLQAFIDGGLDCVVDVGCAEGYYAVGLARLAPQVTVHARDINPAARQACAALAALNGVADRVVVGAEFRAEDFEAFAGRRVLVLVDAEGAEVDILRPDLSPALAQMSIIVETHDLFRPGALAELAARFAATHDITQVDEGPKVFEAPPWMRGMAQLDKLIAVWEWRQQPTPWLVMRPKA